MYLERNPDWLSVRVGDELVMMSITSGDYIGLTETGAAIWEWIGTPRALGSICEELGRTFEVAPDKCRSEVETFVARMEERGAILRRAPDGR